MNTYVPHQNKLSLIRRERRKKEEEEKEKEEEEEEEVDDIVGQEMTYKSSLKGIKSRNLFSSIQRIAS